MSNTYTLSVRGTFKDDITGELNKVKASVSGLSSSIESANGKVVGFGKILTANLASSAITAGLATLKKGISSVGDAIKGVAKSSYDLGADLEQSLGSIDILFNKGVGNDAFDAVKKNAEDAWDTAGVSMNKYIDSLTNFSAALIKGVGGDTQKAADYADMAFRDISDNANAFGTDIDEIIHAYKGFARGQFLMLDNLRLGYTGTHEAAYQLMKDATALDKSFAKRANFSFSDKGHLDVDYQDFVEAIHIIQENMRITGKTAQEVETTIQGSARSMGAAWENLKSDMALGGSIKNDIDNLTIATMRWVKNAGPAMGHIVEGAPAAVDGMIAIAEEMMTKFSDKVHEKSGELKKAGTHIMNAVIEGAITASPNVISLGADFAGFLKDSISEQISRIDLGEAISYMIDLARRGIVGTFDLGSDIIDGISNGVAGDGGRITTALLDALDDVIAHGGEFANKGIELGKSLIEGIRDGISNGKSSAGQSFEEIMGKVPDYVKVAVGSLAGFEILQRINPYVSVFGASVSGLVNIADKANSRFIEFTDNSVSGFKRLASNVGAVGNKALPDILKKADSMKTKLSAAFDKIKPHEPALSLMAKPYENNPFEPDIPDLKGFSAVAAAIKGKIQSALEIKYEGNPFETDPLAGFKTSVTKAIPIVQDFGSVTKDAMGKGLKASANVGLQAVSGLFSGIAKFSAIGLKALPFAGLFAGLLAAGGLAEQAFGDDIDKIINIAVTKGPEIISNFANSITSKLPELINSGTQLFTGLVNVITVNAPVVGKALMDILTTSINGLMSNMDALTEAGGNLVMLIASGIINGLPELLVLGAQLINSLMTSITDHMPDILAGIQTLGTTIIDNIRAHLPEILTLGSDTIMQFLTGMGAVLPELLIQGANILTTLVQTISDNMPTMLEKGKEGILNFINGISEKLPDIINAAVELINTIVTSIVENFPQIMATGAEILTTIIKGIGDNLPALVDGAISIVSNLLKTIWDNFPQILSTGGQVIGELIKGIVGAIPDVLEGIGHIVEAIWNGIMDTDWLKLGSDIIAGIIEGLKNIGAGVWEGIKDAGEGIKDAFCDFFGIASPSKLMRDEVGRFIPEGIAVGIETNTAGLERAVADVSSVIDADTILGGTASSTRHMAGQTSNNSTTYNGGINTYVYGNSGQDAEELANYAIDILMRKIAQEGAVFA